MGKKCMNIAFAYKLAKLAKYAIDALKSLIDFFKSKKANTLEPARSRVFFVFHLSSSCKGEYVQKAHCFMCLS